MQHVKYFKNVINILFKLKCYNNVTLIPTVRGKYTGTFTVSCFIFHELSGKCESDPSWSISFGIYTCE